jgi:hypothetical protein
MGSLIQDYISDDPDPKDIFYGSTTTLIREFFVTNPVPGLSVSHFHMRRRPNIEGSVADPGSGAFLTAGSGIRDR